MSNQFEPVWHSVVVGVLLGTTTLLGGCDGDESTDDAAGGPTGAEPPSADATSSVTDESGERITGTGTPAESGATEPVAETTSTASSESVSGRDDVLDDGAHGSQVDAGDAVVAEQIESDESGPIVEAGNEALPPCPLRLIEIFTWDPVECSSEGFECQVTMTCTGGEQSLLVTCKEGTWQQGPQGCNRPFEFCHETAFDGTGGIFEDPSVICEDGAWVVNGSTAGLADAVGDCPAEPPAEQGDCYGGSTGGDDQEYCGYPCPGDANAWRVANCVLVEGTTPPEPGGYWTYDYACE